MHYNDNPESGPLITLEEILSRVEATALNATSPTADKLAIASESLSIITAVQRLNKHAKATGDGITAKLTGDFLKSAEATLRAQKGGAHGRYN